MGGGGQTTTTTNEPWGPAQQPMKDIYSNADKMWQAGVGPQYFAGDTVAPLSTPTQQALTQGFNMASSGTGVSQPLNNQWTNAINSGGYNSAMTGSAGGMANLASGAGNIDPSALFGVAGSMVNSPHMQSLNQISQSGGGPNYVKQYSEDLATMGPGGANPYFNDALKHQMEQVGNQVAGYMSAKGRYGSGAMGDAMADQMGGLAFQAMSDQYNRDADRRLQASGMIQDASQQGMSNIFNASQGALARQQGALQGVGAGIGVQEGNRGAQVQGLTGLGDIGNAAQRNLQTFGQLAPTVDDLRYADVDRMSKIGDDVEQYQQRLMDDTKRRFDEQNMLPWTQLQNFQDVVQPGAIRLGSSTSNTQKDFNPMSLLGVPLMLAGGK